MILGIEGFLNEWLFEFDATLAIFEDYDVLILALSDLVVVPVSSFVVVKLSEQGRHIL